MRKRRPTSNVNGSNCWRRTRNSCANGRKTTRPLSATSSPWYRLKLRAWRETILRPCTDTSKLFNRPAKTGSSRTRESRTNLPQDSILHTAFQPPAVPIWNRRAAVMRAGVQRARSSSSTNTIHSCARSWFHPLPQP